MKNSCYGYMCSTDYSINLKKGVEFPTIYKSRKALKKDRMCWRECGITKVAILAVFHFNKKKSDK